MVSENRWLMRTGESPPAGRPTDIWGPAVRQPPANPFLFLFIHPPGSPHACTHSAHTRGSRKRLRRRVPLLRPPDATPGPGERGRHGCRGGRRRWDGRRPEAPHVRRRVSPLSFPDSFLPLLLAPPPRSACPPPVPVTRIDICSISLAPGGGAFVRGCTAACSAGSRGDRNAGTVWVTEAVQYD